MRTNEIDWMADLLDSRDVIAYLEHLEAEFEANYPNGVPDEDSDDEPDGVWEAHEELERVRAFCEECERCAPDWNYGETLIADRYFKQYAMDFAEDIGAIPKDNAWPCTCIDWDQAASELQMDYTSVEIDGQTFWIR